MANDGENDDWDVWAFNDAIKKSASFDLALAVLGRLERSQVSPNAVTYHGTSCLLCVSICIAISDTIGAGPGRCDPIVVGKVLLIRPDNVAGWRQAF